MSTKLNICLCVHLANIFSTHFIKVLFSVVLWDPRSLFTVCCSVGGIPNTNPPEGCGHTCLMGMWL